MSLWFLQKQEIEIIHQMLLLQTTMRLRLWKNWEQFASPACQQKGN